ESKHSAGISAGKALQHMRAGRGKKQRLTREIRDSLGSDFFPWGIGDQPLCLLPCGKGRLVRRRRIGGRRHGLRHQGSALQHAGCKDAVGIVERWTEDLAARYVLEGCGDAAMGEETLLPDWLGYRQARLRRSPRAQQEHGLVKV